MRGIEVDVCQIVMTSLPVALPSVMRRPRWLADLTWVRCRCGRGDLMPLKSKIRLSQRIAGTGIVEGDTRCRMLCTNSAATPPAIPGR